LAALCRSKSRISAVEVVSVADNFLQKQQKQRELPGSPWGRKAGTPPFLRRNR